MAEVYTNAKYLAAIDQLEWVDGAVTFRAMLMGTGYTFSAAHIYVSDISASEVSDASYARVDVTSRSVSLDLGGARALLDAADVTFSSLDNITAGSMVIYKQVGVDDSTPTDDPLICYLEFTPTQSPTNQDLRVEFDPDGVVELTTC